LIPNTSEFEEALLPVMVKAAYTYWTFPSIQPVVRARGNQHGVLNKIQKIFHGRRVFLILIVIRHQPLNH